MFRTLLFLGAQVVTMSALGLTPPAAVPVPDAWRTCRTDADCVLVDTTCIGCCENDAILRKFQPELERQLSKLCPSSRGNCDYKCVVRKAACTDHRCGAK